MSQQFLFSETEFRPEQDNIVRGAELSACQKYRYKLWRIWDDTKPLVLFVMHNPSTADHMQDDPTITRCIGFARSWGYGGFYVGNLSPFRCTNPKDLVNDPDPMFSHSMQRSAMRDMAEKCEIVVFAHGVPFGKQMKAATVILNYESGYYLRLTKGGWPYHPLYLPNGLTPIPFKK